jgi:hypothetical protein
MFVPPPTNYEIWHAWLDQVPAVIERERPVQSFRARVILDGTNLSTSSGTDEDAYRAVLVGDTLWPWPGSLSRGLAADLKPLGRPLSFRSSSE